VFIYSANDSESLRLFQRTILRALDPARQTVHQRIVLLTNVSGLEQLDLRDKHVRVPVATRDMLRYAQPGTPCPYRTGLDAVSWPTRSHGSSSSWIRVP